MQAQGNEKNSISCVGACVCVCVCVVVVHTCVCLRLPSICVCVCVCVCVERKSEPLGPRIHSPTLPYQFKKPLKSLSVIGYKPSFFCLQSESSLFRVTFRDFLFEDVHGRTVDRLFAITCPPRAGEFTSSRSTTEKRPMKPKKSRNLACL